MVLNVNDQVALRLEMKLAPLGEAVTVVAEPVRASTSAAVGTLVDRQFVENLPLNGRSFQPLLELTPGVGPDARQAMPSQGSSASTGNARMRTTSSIDGVSANVGVGHGASLGQTAAGTAAGDQRARRHNNLVSVDALQEFHILTSTYAPEFGRTPGAQVSTRHALGNEPVPRHAVRILPQRRARRQRLVRQQPRASASRR